MLCEIVCLIIKTNQNYGLNPCSNGRCSASSSAHGWPSPRGGVLILVLMEDALRGEEIRRRINGYLGVLILVLMEDALRDVEKVVLYLE